MVCQNCIKFVPSRNHADDVDDGDDDADAAIKCGYIFFYSFSSRNSHFLSSFYNKNNIYIIMMMIFCSNDDEFDETVLMC